MCQNIKFDKYEKLDKLAVRCHSPEESPLERANPALWLAHCSVTTANHQPSSRTHEHGAGQGNTVITIEYKHSILAQNAQTDWALYVTTLV